MRGYPRNRLTDRPVGEAVNSRSTMSRGFAISFDDAGAGTAVVLIPGATMSAADWRDAGYVDRLVESHRVVSVDPLGNGLSAKPHDPEAYAWPAVAADIVAVMDAAGVDRAVLWGYSRGGGLAAVVAADYPERVEALILLDGAPTDVAPDSPPTPYGQALSRGDFSLLWDNDAFSFSEADRRYDEAFNDPQALGAMSIGIRRSGLAIDLGRIVAPALVIGGDDAPDDDRRVALALRAEQHTLTGLNHLEVFSRIDLIMPLVNGFLGSRGL